MEDPWGSPWATSDVDNGIGTTSTNADTNTGATTGAAKPEPPPPAFLSTSASSASLSLNLSSSQSAWGDDDGFGDWASADLAPPAPASTWGAWGTKDAGDSGQLTPRYDPRSKASSPQWPSSRATSPGFPPSRLSQRASSDQLSLDPWASELSITVTKRASALEPLSRLPQLSPLPPLPTAADLEHKLVTRASRASSSFASESPSISRAPSPHKDSGQRKPEFPLPTPELRLETIDSPTASSTFEHAQSATQEGSPITSIEDVPLNDGDRKPSKVYKLVEMYDGISKKSSVNTPDPLPAPKRIVGEDASPVESPLPATGDLENAQKHDIPITSTREEELVETDQVVHAEAQLEPQGEFQEQTEDEAEHIIVRHPMPEHEPFEVDLSQLNTILPGLESNVTGADVEVPDHIIKDSFEGVSERKMWYRISRYGPPRKHDLGDDENFLQVTWASSSVRPDTLKIVRRWMEEDSFGGRSFNGGRPRRSSGRGFGWNQENTSPIDLQKFFGSRKSAQAASDASNIPAPDSAVSSIPSSAVGGATFGWSTIAPPTTSAASSRPSSKDEPSSYAPSRVSLDPPPRQVEEGNDEDDDEWGDMVTPSVENFPIESTPSSVDADVDVGAEEPKTIEAPRPDSSSSGIGIVNGTNNAPSRPATQETDSQADSFNGREIIRGARRTHSRHSSSYSSKQFTLQAVTESPEIRQDSKMQAMHLDSALQIIRDLPDLSYMLR